MIGLEGIAEALLLAFIFLITTPLITVLVIHELGFFRSVNANKKKLSLALIFIGLMTLTFLIIRTYPHQTTEGFLIYNLGLIVIWIILRIRKSKKPVAFKD